MTIIYLQSEQLFDFKSLKIFSKKKPLKRGFYWNQNGWIGANYTILCLSAGILA